jgi:hypothetical protein
MRISPETWTQKLSKLFGLEDVQTGDAEFDRAFLINGDDRERIMAVLTPDARKAILDFHRSSLSRMGSRRVFEILDDRVVFKYSGVQRGESAEGAEQNLIQALVDIAGVVDTSPE